MTVEKEKALQFIWDKGYGKGTNFTLNSVAYLMQDYANHVLEEKKNNSRIIKKPDNCTLDANINCTNVLGVCAERHCKLWQPLPEPKK